MLVRGMLAGLIAGVLATGFAYLFGEPSVNTAIGLEESGGGHSHSAPAEPGAPPEAHEHGAAAEPEEELVSRDVQSTLGLFTGVAGYGIAIGGLFSLAFAFAHGRLGPTRPRVTAAVLAAAGYAVVVLVPFLKYPANPPAVGQAGTIGDRTGLYFAFVAISLVVAGVAVAAGRKLAERLGAWGGFLLGAAGYVVVMALCAWLLPVIDEVPEGFPGSTLWTFRTASIGTQLILWTALGLVFGALAEKVAPKRAVAVV
ncbi:CbtA family protein [Amycolatopsis minnesotensis]|uniref:CbtA family protein n=1 Tax=Amycolatopsis minnesotensis TaxID=337894 RepID=A0ABN2QNC5_9PSEU